MTGLQRSIIINLVYKEIKSAYTYMRSITQFRARLDISDTPQQDKVLKLYPATIHVY